MKNNTNGRGEMRRNVRIMVRLATGSIFIVWGHIIWQSIQNADIDWLGAAGWLTASAAIATGSLVSKAMQKKHENNGQ